MTTAAEEYRTRLTLRTAAHEQLGRADARHAYARLALFGGVLLAVVLAWRDMASWWFLLIPLTAFVWLVQRHDAVLRARSATGRAIAFYERGLARLEDRWAGGGEPGDRFHDDTHPYAADLDLFGRGSLFDLLSTARTRAGENTLASWLRFPAPPDEIRSRHEALRELTPALDLREALSHAGADVRAGVDGEALVAWAAGAASLRPRWLRGVAAAISVAFLTSAALWAATGASGPLVAAGAVQLLFALYMRGDVDHTLHGAAGPARDLDILTHLLERLERETFQSHRLIDLRRQLATTGAPASRAIAGLHRLVEMHDWEHNLMFTPIAVALMWGTHIAWAIEAWRRRHGADVGRWLRAIGEIEALSSLASYRYEHPADPFPEIVESDLPTGGAPAALLDGADLAHPLIASSRAVANDVVLAAPTQLLVVSGSNMSGKSTLLRTVGINAVLAFAGAPVRATSLRLTPLAIGATLRIQDSLQEGRSRFYAEISRVRQLADLARGPVPLLFLLDELFHGTNSHDRLAGASGVLRSLVDRGAIGLITTHDLSLTAVADALAPRAVNVHFEDWFDGDAMQFDYRMKPGPVVRSNAIALMRSVGLEVTPDAGA